MTLKLNNMINIEEFFMEFDQTRQLKATGATMQEEDLVCILMLAMPSTLETTIAILDNLPQGTLTLEMAKSKLRMEGERRKALSENKMHVNDATFHTNTNTNTDKCYNCDCRKYQVGRRDFRGNYSRGRSSARGYRGSYRSNQRGGKFQGQSQLSGSSRATRWKFGME